MKAKRLFLANHLEVTNAVKLGLRDQPKLETIYLDYYFDVSFVTEAYLTTDNAISIFLQGRDVLLKNEPSVWRKIKNHLK